MRWRFPCALAMTIAAIYACAAYGDDEVVTNPSVEDAAPPADGGVDAVQADVASLPACDLAAPFRPPEPVANVNTPTATEWCARLSPDGLELYLNVDNELYRHTRTSKTAPFGPRAPLTALNALNTPALGSNIECPFLTPDGNGLLFDRRAHSDAGYDLYFATRSSPVADFSSPRALDGGVNSPDWEWWQWLDGDDLYFTAKRASVTSIHRARRIGAAMDFGPSSPVAELHETNSAEFGPTLTGDGLTIYFARNTGTYVAHRASRSIPFAPPVMVPELERMNPTWVSADGCEIYLFGIPQQSTQTDVYFARKPPRN
jgi:hypothetical protein